MRRPQVARSQSRVLTQVLTGWTKEAVSGLLCYIGRHSRRRSKLCRIKKKTFKSTRSLITSSHKQSPRKSKYGLPHFNPPLSVLLSCNPSLVPSVLSSLRLSSGECVSPPPPVSEGLRPGFSSSCRRPILSCWWLWGGCETLSPSSSSELKKEKDSESVVLAWQLQMSIQPTPLVCPSEAIIYVYRHQHLVFIAFPGCACFSITFRNVIFLNSHESKRGECDKDYASGRWFISHAPLKGQFALEQLFEIENIIGMKKKKLTGLA